MPHSNLANIIFKVVIVFILISKFEQSAAQSQPLFQLDTTIRIDRSIKSTFDRINSDYHKQYKIFKTNGFTRATRNVGIEINEDKLLELSNSIDSSMVNWIVILTIAHEYYHLLQFEYYKRPLKEYERKIFEAQADILAGKYLTFSWLREPNKIRDGSNTLRGSQTDSILHSLFEKADLMFFDLGTNTYAKADHPSKEQRATALSRGFEFGMTIDFVNSSINYANSHPELNLDTTKSKRIIEEHKHRLNLSQPKGGFALTKFADSLYSYKEIMDWSYDQAKLIVHGNPENLVNIIRTDRILTKRGEGIKFQNLGDDTLVFKFEDKLVKNPDDSAFRFEDNFLFNQNNYHTITLYPRNSVIVIDTFFVEKSYTKYIYPPSNFSLFYCTIHKEDPIKENKTFSSLNQQNSDSISFPNYMLLLTDALHVKNYSKIVANMGDYFEISPEKKRNSYYVNYDGVVPPNSNFNCKITRRVGDVEDADIIIDLGSFKDKLKADSVYKYYSQLLESMYGKPVSVLSNNRNKMKFYKGPTCQIHIFSHKIRYSESMNYRHEPLVTKEYSRFVSIRISRINKQPD